MRQQSPGISNDESRPGEEISDVESIHSRYIQDHAVMQRVRWRARRGLLELDIVLGRFIETYYSSLDQSECGIFEELLDMPDNPLWDMIAGRQDATRSDQQSLLEKIRAA